MPYCTQCGNQVGPADLYCAKCGTRQQGAVATPPPPAEAAADPTTGISPRTASILCYIPFVGWLGAIVVLASSRFRHNRTVRFHAFQGLYLFVVWLLVEWVFKHMMFGPFHRMPFVPLLQLGVIAVWVFMLVKTSQEQFVSLPVIGELAERSLTEWT